MSKDGYKGCKKCASGDVYILKWVDVNDDYVPSYEVTYIDTDNKHWCDDCKTFTEIIEIKYDDE